MKQALPCRLDILTLGLVTLATLALLAAIAGRGFSQPLPVSALALLPTVTPTPTPTPVPGLGPGAGGWWDAVSLTPPPLPVLPGLPAVGLGTLGGGGAGSGEAVPFSVIACPQPAVRIAKIVTGRPGWWNVYGTAAIPDLEYWKAELSAQDGGQGWTMLYRSNAAVRDGLLIEFNTRTVPKGAYQLRLLAVDRTGNYGEPCTVGITIR